MHLQNQLLNPFKAEQFLNKNCTRQHNTLHTPATFLATNTTSYLLLIARLLQRPHASKNLAAERLMAWRMGGWLLDPGPRSKQCPSACNRGSFEGIFQRSLFTILSILFGRWIKSEKEMVLLVPHSPSLILGGLWALLSQ